MLVTPCLLPFAVRRDISHKMTPCSNRNPFDQVVKEAGLNPDIMGSNPMTSRFFARAANRGRVAAIELRAARAEQLGQNLVRPEDLG